MALHHHVPTEDLPSAIALFLGFGGIVGMLIAVLLWSSISPHMANAPSSPGEPIGHIPQLVIGAEFGGDENAAGTNEDVSSLVQWLDSHPAYSVVVIPRR